jgi:hypothetical protein
MMNKKVPELSLASGLPFARKAMLLPRTAACQDAYHFDDNMLRVPDRIPEHKHKVVLALQDAARLKRLISHIRYLYRSSKVSKSERIQKLKNRLTMPVVEALTASCTFDSSS